MSKFDNVRIATRARSSGAEHFTDNEGVDGSIPSVPTKHMRIIWGLIGIGLGTLLIWKTYPLVGLFGKVPWAEQHLSSGGTYLLYKLIGLAAIILSGMYMFGLLELFLGPLASIFSGLKGQ